MLSGLHNKIELSFLVVGHTKFSPDGYFGLIRHRYRRSKVYTYEQLAKVVEKSSENGHNICQRYNHNNEKSEIVYRNWSSWLAQYFKTIPNITSYHYFRIDHNERGIVAKKKEMDSKEVKIPLLKEEFPFNRKNLAQNLPERLIPKDLTAERQWYLYKQIRTHIPDEKDKDETCPKPKIAKP